MKPLQKVEEPEDQMPGLDLNICGAIAVFIPVLLAVVPTLIFGLRNGHWFLLFAGLGIGPCAALLSCCGLRCTFWNVPIWVPWLVFVLVYVASALPDHVGFEEKLLITAILVFLFVRVKVSKMTFRKEFGLPEK